MKTKIALCLVVFVAGCGGSGSSNSTAACKLTFSGGLSDKTDCEMGIVYDSLSNTWEAMDGGQGLLVGGKHYNWEGADFKMSGMPSVGTFESTQAVAASAEVDATAYGGTADWAADEQTSGANTGTITLVVTDLGPDDGSGSYSAPHGTFTATMPEATTSAAASVTATETF